MRNTIAIILLLFYFYPVLGQEEKKISLEIQEKPIEQIIAEIEQKTDFDFYYAEEWLDTSLVSKKYDNQLVHDILKDLFKDTEINFFIAWDNRVILTKNNSIYGDLSEGFLKAPDTSKIEVASDASSKVTPILLAKSRDKTDVVVETVRIGKENANRNQGLLKLSGYVTNSRTGEPIPDLAVVVRGMNKGVATDEAGFYEIELPSGMHLIEASAMGIEASKRNVIMYDEGQLNLNLNENLEQLDEVVVKADAIRTVEDTSTGSARIGSEASKNVPLVLGERDVLKIATTLPGVSTAGEGSAGFNVRGGKTDQNLILLDNSVLYNPSHFFGFFQAINPFAINDLVVYKGSIPAEFGGRLSSVF